MLSIMFLKGVSLAPHFNTITFAQSFPFFIQLGKREGIISSHGNFYLGNFQSFSFVRMLLNAKINLECNFISFSFHTKLYIQDGKYEKKKIKIKFNDESYTLNLKITQVIIDLDSSLLLQMQIVIINVTSPNIYMNLMR